jgi:hypothetical protein
MRFVVLLKALTVDKSNQQSVNEYNDAIQLLKELQSPGTKKKIKTPEDVTKIMQDFKLNFPKIKAQKLKNFNKAN